MEKTTKVSCPHCGGAIDVQQVLAAKVHEELQAKYDSKFNQLDQDYVKRKQELISIQEKINLDQEQINNRIQQSVVERLALERTALEKQIRDSIDNEKSEQIKSYQSQLDEKAEALKDHYRLKAEMERILREKDELKDRIEAETEAKFTERLNEERLRIKTETDSKAQLKMMEREMIIDQLKEQLSIAQKKAEQGSMQLQGEVQELAIENFLQENFPNDEIEEIKKGAKGADCVHYLLGASENRIGGVYYESKRTKDFQSAWIEKFKRDMRQRNVNFGVLVTEVFPKGMDRMGMVSGIWICSFEEFKGLCFVLRQAVLMLHEVSSSQVNSGTKMELLYQYLTGSEFRGHVEAIVDGFAQMQTDLQKEKRSMESIWKQREKQIHSVLINTTQMYSAIKGIAGNAIAQIPALALPEAES